MSSYRLQYADNVARNSHRVGQSGTEWDRVGHAAASGTDMTGG